MNGVHVGAIFNTPWKVSTSLKHNFFVTAGHENMFEVFSRWPLVCCVLEETDAHEPDLLRGFTPIVTNSYRLWTKCVSYVIPAWMTASTPFDCVELADISKD